MADWEKKLNQFLQFNGREVLQNFGTVKREVAETLAIAEYEKYDAHRKSIQLTDFDALNEGIKKLKNGWITFCNQHCGLEYFSFKDSCRRKDYRSLFGTQ